MSGEDGNVMEGKGRYGPSSERDGGATGSDSCIAIGEVAASDSQAHVEAAELNSIRPARVRRGGAAGTAGKTTEASSGRPHPAAPDIAPVPQDVLDRFVQDGKRFYFRDGRLAFRDHGRKLSTAGENLEVIASLIDIARSRSWQEVTLEGSKGFCRHAWRRGRQAGLLVRGYTPSAGEHAALIRARSGDEERASRQDGPVEESVRPPPRVPVDGELPAQGSEGPQSTGHFFVGKLLAHGLAPYRWNPRKRMHYFIRIDASEGPRTVWSRDFQRALEQSRSQPRVGDEVVLRRVPSESLPAKSQGAGPDDPNRGADGLTRRQGWVIEKQAFLEARAKLAEVFRDPAIAPRDAVKQHPDLSGAYISLRAAELAARQFQHPEDRKVFVEKFRNRLANSIALGDPFPKARMRVRRDEGQPDLERGCPRAR